jgi:membrane protein implicated in regulation of membrane protease activity
MLERIDRLIDRHETPTMFQTFFELAKTWLSLAVFFMILELTLPFFGCSLLSAAALLSAVAAGLSFSWEVQTLIFALVSILFTALLRPMIVRKLQTKTNLPSRVDRLLGKSGEVTEALIKGQGRVLVEGQDWKAEGEDDLISGSKIVVIGSDGIVLKVRKANV